MASSWADRLPRVTVPDVSAPKSVTIVLPFYECQRFFTDVQVRQWRQEAMRPMRPHVSVIVVDDGSPTPAYLPSLDVMRPFPMRLFRIEQDVPWNWLAARNIGAKYAETHWILLTDMDHVVPAPTLFSLVMGRHNTNVVYAFSRREHTGEPVAPHSASFFMTRAMFWKIGGYDERLSGVYGTDGLYRKRVQAIAPIQVLTDELIRYEFVEDSSVRTLERKTAAMARARMDRIASLPSGPPLTLSFPYHEVTA